MDTENETRWSNFFENRSLEDLLIPVFLVLIIVVLVILFFPKKDEPVKQNNVIETRETIILSGNNPYYLLRNNRYEEPGYTAYDANGNNVSYNVVVRGNVDYKTPGRYEITYQINSTIITRTVVVSNIEPIFVDESDGYTSDGYTIMLRIKGNDYLKTVLPDNNESKFSAIEYGVSKNGVYKFIVYDKYDNKIEIEREVKTIDLEAPTGSCTNKLDLGKTYVEVQAIDSLSGISKYIYNNGEKNLTSTESKYTYSGLYKNVNVTIVDKVGNKATIKCVSSGTGAEAQIKPPSGANIIRTAESDTLKVSIENKNGYYLTRVWVLDPYNQINKGIIRENWNKQRSYAIDILNSEISRKGLNNKIVVGINGSGFYENGTWTPSCSSYYLEKYNRTTEGPLVIYDGTVIRNWYESGAVDGARNHSIYTVSKSGDLEVYQNFNKLSENERKDLFNSIINKGYRNTWTFRPVAILNGNVLTTNLVGGQLKNRNIVCQINRNNWVILTGEVVSADAINTLQNLGCKTAVNMDGSSSVSLHFKGKTGSLEKIHGGTRAVVDTLYFTEK